MKEGWFMTKNLKGFTLAEVLITLGLIGVVVALVIPAISSSVETSKIETSLSKIVNTLSNTNERMALANGSEDVVSEVDSKTYLTELAEHLQNSKLIDTAYTIDGTSTDTTVLSTDDGISIIAVNETIDGCTANCTSSYNRKYFGKALTIAVDVDGKKGSNLYGRDQFLFYVDKYGALIPKGGIDYNNYKSNDGHGTGAPNWQTTCESNKKSTPKTPSDCTASVIENGYKIQYGFRGITKPPAK